MEEIKCRFQVLSADLAKIQDQVVKSGNVKTLILVLGGACVLIISGIIFGLYRAYLIFRDGGSYLEKLHLLWDDQFAMLGLIMICVIPVTFLYSYFRKKAAKNFDAGNYLVDVVVCDENISFSDSSGTSRIPWNDFSSTKETDEFFIFFESDSRCRYLPKRILNDVELEFLREIIKEPATASGSVDFSLEDEKHYKDAIRCSGQVEYDEYSEGMFPFYRIYRVLFIIISIVLFLLLGMELLNRYFPEMVLKLNNGHPPVSFGDPLKMALLICAFVAFQYFMVFYKKKARRDFEKDEMLHEKADYVLTPELLVVASRHGKSTVRWNEYIRWKETKLTFRFQDALGIWRIFPKRFLSDGDRTILRGWLKDSINGRPANIQRATVGQRDVYFIGAGVFNDLRGKCMISYRPGTDKPVLISGGLSVHDEAGISLALDEAATHQWYSYFKQADALWFFRLISEKVKNNTELSLAELQQAYYKENKKPLLSLEEYYRNRK